MRAMVSYTVRVGQNQPLCSMVAISSHPRRWTASEMKLVEEVAERTWSALEKVRIAETLRKTEERARLAIEAAELATGEWDGQPLRASGIMFDITDRKEVQEALQESETHLSAIFESLPIGIGVVNKRGRITHCNKQMEYYMPKGFYRYSVRVRSGV